MISFFFSFEIAMISSFSLCSIRVAGLAYPATKKELVVYSTFLFYQDFIFLSNTYVSFEMSFLFSKKNLGNLDNLMEHSSSNLFKKTNISRIFAFYRYETYFSFRLPRKSKAKAKIAKRAPSMVNP